ncbi:MAG: type 11 methyltransferase [Anaerolineaceae bacterium]|nr:MAG: type 11 methyltransferase [Anaerolineaceae bacterium]
MDPTVISILKCPVCGSGRLSSKTFPEAGEGKTEDGVVWCPDCSMWYPVEDGLLELLAGDLIYREDRVRFARRYSANLVELGLDPSFASAGQRDSRLQIQQQSHFDWYAQNAEQSYSEYEQTPFWLAADRIAFDAWRKEAGNGKWLVDLGCAQGRSAFKLMDLDLHIVGMDVSKRLVRQALERYRLGNYRAKAAFLVADASSLPLVDESIDYVLIYGVLHHLPDPKRTCREVARVLKTGGVYFGSENNQSVFRKIFDLLQKIRPLWFEEAGPEALISAGTIGQAFSGTGVSIQTSTSVFLPPHLLNLMNNQTAYRWLRFFDGIGRHLPLIKNNGGLILIRGEKG